VHVAGTCLSQTAGRRFVLHWPGDKIIINMFLCILSAFDIPSPNFQHQKDGEVFATLDCNFVQMEVRSLLFSESEHIPLFFLTPLALGCQ